MTGGLMSHADLEARFAVTQWDNKNEEQTETVYRDAKRRKRRGVWSGIQRDDKERARREMELEPGKGFERYAAVCL
jgi:hypothetical protein